MFERRRSPVFLYICPSYIFMQLIDQDWFWSQSRNGLTHQPRSVSTVSAPPLHCWPSCHSKKGLNPTHQPPLITKIILNRTKLLYSTDPSSHVPKCHIKKGLTPTTAANQDHS